jgi:GcrA cell cycle regulator
MTQDILDELSNARDIISFAMREIRKLRGQNERLMGRRSVTIIPWTNNRVDQLKSLWADNLSANQIARAMGGCSRNAVIGKVHRLGLAHRRSAYPRRATP